MSQSVAAVEGRLAEFDRVIRAAAMATGDREPDETVRRAMLLAGHAALPVAIDAGFLHLLRVNFFLDRQTLPYWMEARLLLSPLCRPSGDDLYEMDSDVRDALLARLAGEYGSGRIRQIATLLWQYTERHPTWANRRELRHAQQITALNFLEEDRARTWLDEAEHGAGGDSLPGEWFVAMRAGLPALPPAPATSGDPLRVAQALAGLDFAEQKEGFAERGLANIVVVSGPRGFGPHWLIDVLLHGTEYLRVDVALNPDNWGHERGSWQSLASVLGIDAPPIADLEPMQDAESVRERFSELIGERSIAIVARGVNQGTERSAAELAEIFVRTVKPGKVLLFLVGEDQTVERPAESAFIQTRSWDVVKLPPLQRFSADATRRWVETTSDLEPALSVPLRENAVSIWEATGGVPERMLEQLSFTCGVRWPDVKIALRRPFVAKPRDPLDEMLALGREYKLQRATIPPGDARNLSMRHVAGRMRALADISQEWPLDEWTTSADDAVRLAAMIVLQRHPHPSYLSWLASRLKDEKPFVAHQSTMALAEAAKKLPTEHLALVEQALAQARANLGGGKDHTERAKMLNAADATVASRRPSPPKKRTSRRSGFESLHLWPPGSTIKVQFLDGSPALQKRVRDVAEEWLEHANLRFDWVTRGGEIRITFQEAGNWSYLGAQARHIAVPAPTMSLESVSQSTDEEFRQIVLGQFGHALGLINEHQNPNARIPWDTVSIMRAMTGPPNHWTPDSVRHNVLRRMSVARYRPYDPDSVMVHYLPAEWLLTRKSIGGKASLSKSDKVFIAELYPGKRPVAAAATPSRPRATRKRAPKATPVIKTARARPRPAARARNVVQSRPTKMMMKRNKKPGKK